jgi:hypothetical protein
MLISVLLHHYLVLLFGEIILGRLIMVDENTLSRLALKISIDKPSSLSFICGQFQWDNCLPLRIPQRLFGFPLFLAHTFFLGGFQRFFEGLLQVKFCGKSVRVSAAAGDWCGSI